MHLKRLPNQEWTPYYRTDRAAKEARWTRDEWKARQAAARSAVEPKLVLQEGEWVLVRRAP